MTLNLTMVATAGLILLTACQGGTLGSGTNLGGQAADIDTTLTTPEGIQQTQTEGNPTNVSECLSAAQRIEATTSTEVERQAALEDIQRLGCPT